MFESKKLAILVFGEFREFENAHKSWTFLDGIDFDLFISTWNKSYEVNEHLDINICEDVTEQQILKWFPKAIINIENNMTSGLTSTKMIYHWKKLFNMMTISGNEYEIVILIRPDVYLKRTDEIKNIINNIPDKTILFGLSEITIIPPPEHIYVNDCLFIGESHLMRNIFLSFYEPDITRKCIHYHLAKHFTNNDIFVQRIMDDADPFFIMRSIHRKYLERDYKTKKQISEIYEELKHQHHKLNTKTELLNKLKSII